ncbi:hypothetical protein KKD70_03600 [Patescibacteria group bacterium]|nr:hypothetical protein [Patescibacteria group bacterium]
MLLLFRGSIRKLSEDDSVFMINNNTAFKIVQIMNINKNLFADQLKECWNQQNPHIGCSDENEIVPGTYILKNGDNLSWIDGPHSGIITDKIFKLSEREVRDSMHGFMRNDLNYYQQINISYTGQDSENEAMEIEITTINDDGDKSVKNIRSTRY